ncbi:MerR family transcriptional regulator [Mobilicoccus massiliensis]|uniref:MerR family transcriptional regulator n=1 Tax=Mobilicoccus massiliensis TaxID=1522310 RepID=UPI0005912E04|nr:MerR family transcriptional regulator [Mobilicoccus massiliensis]
MRLKELAERADTSPASIKYYLREGLLRPGRRVNATLAEYDEGHLRRLDLISALRRVVGASIDDIRALVADIDDPERSLYDVLGRAQMIGLGMPPASSAGDEPESVTRLLEHRGWGTAIQVRGHLAEQVRLMTALGIEVRPERLEAYADAAASVADLDIDAVATATSRDEAAMRVAVGVHTYSRLFLRMLAVAQAGRADELLG